jgi:hypothetical protein
MGLLGMVGKLSRVSWWELESERKTGLDSLVGKENYAIDVIC